MVAAAAGVSVDSLRHARARQECRNISFSMNRKLSPAEEEVLVGLAVGYAVAKEPLSTGQLCDFVKRIHEVEVSDGWVREFVRRHSDDLRINQTHLVTPARASSTVADEIKVWVLQWGRHVERAPVLAHTFMYYDENTMTRRGFGTTLTSACGSW